MGPCWLGRLQHGLPLPGGVTDRERWAACGAPELMIGEELSQAVTGRGHLARSPPSGCSPGYRVRGWIWRACEEVERLCYNSTLRCVMADANSGLITPAGSLLGDAMEILALAAMELRRRFDEPSMPEGVGPLELTAAFTRGTQCAIHPNSS